ncbi:MAG: hypothetical protein E7091_07450 [Bacteroidales bacterium]|nr:hypothetical protein [Bacteroidales bacterium]
MRKIFTLFFMSMFLVIGTAMAQDDSADSLKLTFLNPKDGAMETSVYNIRLQFNKDVTATLPEGGIDVVNNDTKEVVKITRIYKDEWTPANTVLFYFEQKMMPDKDGKGEELQDQYIDTPGSYSYTIPAGCIKSVDGEEFAEHTFTFSVVGTFGVESYSPQTTSKLEKIQITFTEEVTEVIFPNSGLPVVDGYWTPVSWVKNDVVISEDKKTVTFELEEPITAEGTYGIDLYQGTFVGPKGINTYSSLMFNVIDSNPSFVTNFQEGERVKEIGNLEITFRNVSEVKLVEGAEPVTAYLPGDGEATGKAALANNRITVTFDQQFTEEGVYTFVIPAGMFTMDGVPNEPREINITLFTFSIIPLEVDSVIPAMGTVDKLDRIIVVYNQDVTLSMDENWQQISREIALTCGDKVYTLTYNSMSNLSNKIEYLVNAQWTGYEYESTPITEAGTYTLNLADIIVDHAVEDYIDEWGYPNKMWHSKGKSCEGTYTWTISGDNAIKVVAPETGEQVIYDLLGRRIEKIVGDGIYIVNGKKVVIK